MIKQGLYMTKNILVTPFFIILLILLSAAYFGCEQKKDDAEKSQDKDSVSTTAGQATGNKTNPDSVIQKSTAIPDITGKWTGTFDKRSTVLEITGQTDSSFTGKITISYREVINQQVNGSFSPTNMKMSMSDQLHSRYRGKYNGVLSENFNNFSGTFTMATDNSQFAFNLNKK